MSDILPITHLDDYEVRDILNKYGGKTDNVHGSKYRSAAQINWGSRYKPVRSTELFKLTDAMFKEVDWGYRIPQPVNMNEYIAGIDGNIPSEWEQPDDASVLIRHGWYYQRPTGGVSQPFRMADYIGYDAKAPKSLFGEVQAPSVIDQDTKNMYVSVDMGTFSLSDFSAFDNMFIGVLIKGDGVQRYKSIPSPDSTSAQHRVDFNETEMGIIFADKYGTYTVYVFVTATEGQNISKDMDYYLTNMTDIYPLPVSDVKMEYKYVPTTSSFTFTLTEMSATRDSVSFKVTAHNRTSSPMSVTPNALRGRVYAYNDEGDWSDESTRALANRIVSVPANSSAVVGTFSLAYSAYREIQEPWYVQVEIYYPNSDGESVYAGSGTTYYEGE